MGKTTLLELAVAQLHLRRRKVLVLKSSHHALTDRVGSDSHRLTQAGADAVILRGIDGCRIALDPPPTVEELLEFLAGRFDFALIEGGKSSSLPKVELLADAEPMLSQESVVGRLRRGEHREDPAPVTALLELLESKGRTVGAAKL